MTNTNHCHEQPVALMSDKLGEPNLLFEKELSHFQRKEQQRVAAFGAGTHTVRTSMPGRGRESTLLLPGFSRVLVAIST